MTIEERADAPYDSGECQEVEVKSNGIPIELPDEWGELAAFQVNVAEQWLMRGQSSGDVYAQFFFYFAGLNALYFLWGRVDNIRNQQREPAGEEKQIHNLLCKIRAEEVGRVLSELDDTVRFFQERPGIQRMDSRDVRHQSDGDPKEGTKWRDELVQGDEQRRLLALGSILYLVRSNLVHGSKMESSDDPTVIQKAVPALKLLLAMSLRITTTASR